MAFRLSYTLKRLRETDDEIESQSITVMKSDNLVSNEFSELTLCPSVTDVLNNIITTVCTTNVDTIRENNEEVDVLKVLTSSERDSQINNDLISTENDIQILNDQSCVLSNSDIQIGSTQNCVLSESDMQTENVQNYVSTENMPLENNEANENPIAIDSDACNLDCQTMEDNYVPQQLFNFKNTPLQLTGSWSEFQNGSINNYTRGCKWAPDGSCILTCSNDNTLRIFNMPLELWDTSKWQEMSEMASVLKVSEGEIIYDYCWYPMMNSADPCTCCFASCSRNSTVHLWDGFTGALRCSYRAYDQMDEITAPRSLSFNSDGSQIFCGFEKAIRVYNIDVPGRNCIERRTFDKKSGQSGIISCFAFTSANKSISAAGSYQRTIGIYSEPNGTLECVLEGHKSGLTHLQFSPDGNLLYSGGRKDSDILCWDIRNLGEVLYCMRRSCLTNQRMYFDISRDGRYVISGNTNGVISIWDTTSEPKEVVDDFNILVPTQFFMAHNDCVNGISIHPTFPLLCSSSGQRKFAALLSDDEDGMFSTRTEKSDNSLRLWWIGES